VFATHEADNSGKGQSLAIRERSTGDRDSTMNDEDQRKHMTPMNDGMQHNQRLSSLMSSPSSRILNNQKIRSPTDLRALNQSSNVNISPHKTRPGADSNK